MLWSHSQFLDWSDHEKDNMLLREWNLQKPVKTVHVAANVAPLIELLEE